MGLKALSNKYWRIAIYSLALLFTNVLHAGWIPMVRFMRDSGKFAWLCPADSVPDPVSGMLCEAQDQAFSMGLAIVSACDFSTGVFAGTFFDILGPQWTGIVGQLMMWVCLPMIAFSNNSAGMFVGFAFMGLCAYFTGYPALSIGADFQEHENLAMTFVMAVQYATSLVYAVLYEIGKTTGYNFTQVTVAYWIFIIPIGLTRAQIDAERFGTECRKARICDVCSPTTRKYLRTPEWIACMLWQCVTFFSHATLVNTMLVWGGEGVANFYGFFYVASLLSTFFWGYIGRLTDITLMLNVVSVGFLLSFLFSFGSEPYDYVAASANCLMGGYFFNAKSIWTNFIFPPEYLGRLTGLAATITGIFTLVATIPVTHYGVNPWLAALALTPVVGLPLFLTYRCTYLKICYREDGVKPFTGSELSKRSESSNILAVESSTMTV
ncbi:MAG: uncharacterized protein KVP18_004113 [Porospora cf. gigantea A]|uniref:uncharacterized protein n=1 Tax=Porospora cf. gigantea A TaxID=2853593 RepID=UPI003559E2A7|nr:MAG: hypothetical protein KVP18_004113 [Porospora cf. gigantea A]